MTAYAKPLPVPREFVYKRLHSLMGLWFLIFLIEHLFTNSQVALFFGNNGIWFVNTVDWLRNIPYLQAIEVGLLGIPILYHAGFGIYYSFSSRSNSRSSSGAKPALKYGRNIAYTWQRITAWILLIGIVLHVVQMRFIDYPYKYRWSDQVRYYARLKVDPLLYSVADRLNVKLYDQNAIAHEKEEYAKLGHKISLVEARKKELLQETREHQTGEVYNSEMDNVYQSLQKYELLREHIRGLEKRTIQEKQVIAVSQSFGALELLNVREAFQSVTMCVLYTLFVFAAVFHGFNGLWTFLITWGLILSRQSQSSMKNFSLGLMFIFGCLGLMAIWGTFFLSF